MLKDIDPQNAALLVIDVQKEFCDPADKQGCGNAETAIVSGRIRDAVPAFRELEIPVYIFYVPFEGAKKAHLYKLKRRRGDTVIAKRANSAFTGGNLKDILERDGRESLLVCGFNQVACIKETVTAACSLGFQVCLMEDLTGNGKYTNVDIEPHLVADASREMENAGVITASSKEVLSHLRAPRP
jgi:nicotinamidase-related amidase